jgi:hypothetical protein
LTGVSRYPRRAHGATIAHMPVEPSARALYLGRTSPAETATMTTFDKRESAFEDKFAHDADLQFKVSARRNKLLGLWAAQLLKLTPEEADAYAKSVIAADFEEVGDEDVFRKVFGDISAAGVAVTENEVRAQMDALLDVAKRQIMA